MLSVLLFDCPEALLIYLIMLRGMFYVPTTRAPQNWSCAYSKALKYGYYKSAYAVTMARQLAVSLPPCDNPLFLFRREASQDALSGDRAVFISQRVWIRYSPVSTRILSPRIPLGRCPKLHIRSFSCVFIPSPVASYPWTFFLSLLILYAPQPYYKSACPCAILPTFLLALFRLFLPLFHYFILVFSQFIFTVTFSIFLFSLCLYKFLVSTCSCSNQHPVPSIT